MSNKIMQGVKKQQQLAALYKKKFDEYKEKSLSEIKELKLTADKMLAAQHSRIVSLEAENKALRNAVRDLTKKARKLFIDLEL